jgi:hypothetical protein
MGEIRVKFEEDGAEPSSSVLTAVQSAVLQDYVDSQGARFGAEFDEAGVVIPGSGKKTMLFMEWVQSVIAHHAPEAIPRLFPSVSAAAAALEEEKAAALAEVMKPSEPVGEPEAPPLP